MKTSSYIAWKLQQRHVNRIRRAEGIAPLDLPEDRDAGSAWVVILCAAGMVAAWVLGMALS